MKNSKKIKKRTPYDEIILSIGIAIGLLCMTLHIIITGEPGSFKGAPIYQGAAWILFICAVFMLILSVRALLHRIDYDIENPKSKSDSYCPYTDEEIAEAERTMDALYLREHGELPDKARSDDTKTL